MNKRTHKKDGSEMVYIPEGPFLMGAKQVDIFAPEDQKPEIKIYLSPFWIDICPITNKQISKFIMDEGYDNKDYWDDDGWIWKNKNNIRQPLSLEIKGCDGDDQPVAGVSWYEAQAYCKWSGKNLPTEAQWEKAARGIDCRPFPWGNSLPTKKRCNFNNHIGHPSEVNMFPLGRSPYGCYDMSGNVNNWCRDSYFEKFYAYCLSNKIERNPIISNSIFKKLDLYSPKKVDRGGGFATSFFYWDVLTCYGRMANPPETREIWNGFRCIIEENDNKEI